MRNGVHNRMYFVTYVVAALLSAAAFIATIVEPRWFELLFDAAPDNGDGSLETLIAVVLAALACLAFSMLARREWIGMQALRGRAPPTRA
jgi:formate hydrogenlyase subunit 3/multisubunit Na+/H+ antiporter MnhD subunit